MGSMNGPCALLQEIQSFCLRNFLVLAFATAAIVALSIPVLGKTVGDVKVGDWGLFTSICVGVIFVISGLTLSTNDIKEALGAWKGALLGLSSILVLTPLFGFVPLEIPFQPEEFKIGLAIFCMMPTTLSSGVALVNQAKGNGALALMLTVVSNLLAIGTIPFVSKLVLSVSNISLEPLPLFLKLVSIILVPLLIGKAIREASEAVQAFVKAWKVQLGLLNNGCLACVAWMKLSQSADKFKDTPIEHIASAIGAGIAIHCIFLTVNYVVLSVPLWDLQPREFKAVLLMSSQKTLPVAVTVIGFLPESIGEQGLMVIPCIISHMSQIFMDAAIVSRWAAQDAEEQAAKDAEDGQVVSTELVITDDGDEVKQQDGSEAASPTGLIPGVGAEVPEAMLEKDEPEDEKVGPWL